MPRRRRGLPAPACRVTPNPANAGVARMSCVFLGCGVGPDPWRNSMPWPVEQGRVARTSSSRKVDNYRLRYADGQPR
jgi:hypothetical protein